jgi:hypothetical protein
LDAAHGWWILLAALAGALHAAALEHDHPIRMLAARRGRGRTRALGWAAGAALLHLPTSLVTAWLCFFGGNAIATHAGPVWLAAAALLWVLLYALATQAGWLTGHLLYPMRSLLFQEDGTGGEGTTPARLAAAEGLNACLLPVGLWAAAAPRGLALCLGAAVAWSLAVSLIAAAKLFAHFPRHPRALLGLLERRADLLAALAAALAILLL